MHKKPKTKYKKKAISVSGSDTIQKGYDTGNDIQKTWTLSLFACALLRANHYHWN